ncbi:uncharacterized protein LOC122519004 [Polistes fuscatus]|uniref:uncharacterized protein LOC122519004 n=1 Tax=Polistes fuscatus TaxID=30207 RepID=UPI001CA86F41|nr:uncharacterized protein LOC122519004 [Polistes fuscatus]
MADQARIDDIRIPIFDGVNYSAWKFRLLTLLEYKECDKPAIRKRLDTENEASWKKLDLKAKTILISSVSDKQLEYLIDEFFIEFEKACNEFKQAGGKLLEEEKMRYIIKALPSSYAHIGDFIDLVPEDQNTSTFNVKTKGQCFNCGKTGHDIKDCRHNKQRQYQKSSRGQMGSRRGNTYRGRGRGHEQQQKSSHESWATQVVQGNVNQCSESENENENIIEWLLDSGCTDHIVNDQKYLCDITDLRNPIEVILPNDKKLKATKIGSNKVVASGKYAKIYNNYHKLTAVAEKTDGLYHMTSFIRKNNKDNVYPNSVKITSKEKWHRALGHINFRRTRSKEILEVIHTDLNGPHRTPGYKGERYFVSFIDDYSRCTKIYCIKKYLNKRIYDFVKSKGIEILNCPPYVHELNGVAERYNRSAMDMGRCLAREAKVNINYRVLVDNKVIDARHVEVIENENDLIYENGTPISVQTKEELRDSDEDKNNEVENTNEKIGSNEWKNESNRDPESVSQRTRNKVKRFGDPTTYCISVNYMDINVPQSFEEALNCEEHEKWEVAMKDEIKNINENKTWVLVNRKNSKNIIDTKWVYTKKVNGRFRARLVARGFKQKNAIDDIYAPVASNQPKGFSDGTDRVMKLVKSMYGLSESPRDWYRCFNKYVESLGFRTNGIELCLYVHDMGEIKEYLGIEIDYNIEKNEMKLSQSKYIEKLADKYDVVNSKCYNTPMETRLNVEKPDCCNENIMYKNLLGALLYISSGTRPDISYSVNYLSRFQNCYTSTHFRYALRILKYLYGTRDLKLCYNKNENYETVDCYVDADWAGDSSDRKSTTGYAIRLYGNLIYWKSRKQKCITKASTYAEYVALSELVTEGSKKRKMGEPKNSNNNSSALLPTKWLPDIPISNSYDLLVRSTKPKNTTENWKEKMQ